MNPLLLLPSLPAPGSTGQPARTYAGQVITPFDFGLSAADLAAIRIALQSEMNPNHLVGFASTLAGDHPVSASLLYARGALLEQRPRGKRDAMMADGAHAAERLRQLVDRITSGKWSGISTTAWISQQPLDVGKSLAEIVRMETSGRWPGACESFQRVSPSSSAVHWPRLDRLSTAAEGAQAFQSILGAAPQTSDAQVRYESALALAQPVPLSMASQYPTAAALQAFGFHELYPRTRGQDVLQRATDFAHSVLLGHKLGIDAWVALLLQRRSELDALIYGGALSSEKAEREVRRAASDLVVDPRADLSDMPSEVILLARSLVIEIGPDVRVVDPLGARMALRPVPLETRTADRQRWTANYHKSALLDGAEVHP